MRKALFTFAALLMCSIQSALASTVTVKMNSTAKVMTFVEKVSQTAVNVGTPTSYTYTFEAAPGTYVLTGWDADSHTKDYGTIEIEVTDEPQQEFQVFVVTATCQSYYADTKTGWAYGTDYTMTDLRCNTREGKLIPITLSNFTNVATSGNKYQSKYLLTLNGSSYNFRVVPSDAHKAEGYMDTFGSGTMTANATCSFTIPSGLTFTVTYPSDANLEVYQKPGGTNGSGSIHYVKFMDIPSTSKVSKGGTITRTYTLAEGTTYNYRLWKDGKRTKAGMFVPYKPFSLDESKKWGGDYDGFTSLTFTSDDLGVDAKWMNHDVTANNKANVANILLTVNERGHLTMKAGQTKMLGAQRDWQLTNTSTANYFIEPQYHYTILNLDGTTGNDVVTIEKAADDFSPWATLKANKAGSALVLVSYDAMKVTQIARSGSGTEKSPYKITESDYYYGSEWSALWPENTGVFVVTVDGAKSSVEPNMLINEKYNTGTLKNAGKYVDAEHDVFYYLESEPGFTYTFTPSGVASVEMAYPTIGETMASYKGFGTKGVTKNADGSYSLLLKNGRQIVKLTDAAGHSVYQVLTAKPCTQTITNMTRNDGTFMPGDDIEIQFAGLYHPANKMSGIYNMSAYVTYKGVPNGTELILSANQYQFAGTPSAQLVKARIPANWNPEEHFIMDNAVLQVNGYGDPIGNHRLIDPVAGRSPNFTAIAHQTYFGALPNIDIAVGMPDYVKAGFNIDANGKQSDITLVNGKGDSFDLQSDNRFWLIPDTYTYTIVTDGYKYVTGTLKITGEETADVILPIALESIPANGWDGLTVREPAKVTAEEAATDEFAGMENYYKITTGFEFAWIANNVNVNKVAKTNAVLCNDITLSDMPFTTIGNAAATPFSGVLEGNGHTISGININGTTIYKNNLFGYCDNITVRNFTAEGKITTTATYASIIGRVQNGATISGITSKLDITSTGSGSAYASGIVSWLVGANGAKYNVERCEFAGTITATGRNYVAGIVGYNTGNYDNITVKDCAVRGTIKAANYVAGIIPVFGGANSAKAKIENCLVTANITATGASVGAIWANTTAATGVKNCYTNKAQKLTADQGEVKTAEQLKSGEVAVLLGEAWGQEIGKDATPVLGGLKVRKGLNGYTNAEAEDLTGDYDLAVLTFEDEDYKGEGNYVGTEDWSTLIDDPQYGGLLLYGDYGMGVDEIEYAYRWSDDNNTWLSNIISEGYGSWCYWSGGHAISNYGSGDVETYGDYNSQLTVFKKGETELVREGAGHNGSNNFAVHYGYADNSGYGLGEEALPRLTFADGNARVIDHMYINATCYALNCYINGNSLTAAIGDEDWVKIVATGYKDGNKGKTSEFYLVNGPKHIIMDWTKWDLSSLGLVDEVTFNIMGSSDNGYGFSQPAYFAYDDVAVRIPKTETYILADKTPYISEVKTKLAKLAYTRTFGTTKWQPLYVPFTSGYEAWSDDVDIAKVADTNGAADGVLTVTYLEEGEKVEANTPYLIRAKQTGDIEVIVEDVTLVPAAKASVEAGGIKLTGTYSPIVIQSGTYSVLHSGSIVQTSNSAGYNLPAMRWYVEGSTSEVKVLLMGDEETGIETVDFAGTNEAIYGTDGVRHTGLKKGINLVRKADGSVIKILVK